jgi:hypothetical protein
MMDTSKLVPGLQGDHRGTCVVCIRPTDTGLKFKGDAEWIIASLMVLGLSQDVAYGVLIQGWQERYGTQNPNVPSGILTEQMRVCGSCVRKCGKKNMPAPALIIAGGEMPVVECRN